MYAFADTFWVYAADGVWILSEDGEAEYAGSAADLFRARDEGRPVAESELPRSALPGLAVIIASLRPRRWRR